MGYIQVNSPYDNNPVKVLEKDIGRAVKDGEGRTFYVLPKSDGSGYFGAISRADPGKEEADAVHRETKQARADASAATTGHLIDHGPRGGGLGKVVKWVLLIGLVGMACYLWYTGKFSS